MIKKLLFIFLFTFSPFVYAGFQSASAAASQSDTHLFTDVCSQVPNDPTCVKVGQTTSDVGSNPATGANGIVHVVTNIFAVIAGIAAVLVIIAGGFRYVTAGSGGGQGGDSSNSAANAKKMITNAVIGLVVIALAWSIVTFAVDRFVH